MWADSCHQSSGQILWQINNNFKKSHFFVSTAPWTIWSVTKANETRTIFVNRTRKEAALTGFHHILHSALSAALPAIMNIYIWYIQVHVYSECNAADNCLFFFLRCPGGLWCNCKRSVKRKYVLWGFFSFFSKILTFKEIGLFYSNVSKTFSHPNYMNKTA